MKEIILEFIFGNGEHQMAIAPLAIAAIGAAPGLIKAAGSLFGGGKRRRAERNAKIKKEQEENALRNFKFENQYANLENTAEDLTVNQQASNFQAAQSDQALASAQDAIVQSGAGGGGGAAALVQGALQSKQNISADLASQESANQQARAAQAAQNQQLEAQGAQAVQNQEYGRQEKLFGLAAGELAAAQKARQQAKADLVGGLAGAAGGAASALAGSGNLGGGGGQGFNLNTGVSRLKDNPLNRLYNSPLNNNGEERKKGEERRTTGEWETLEDGRQRRKTTIEQDYETPGKSYAEAGVSAEDAQAYWDANPEEYAKYQAAKNRAATGAEYEYRDAPVEERQPKMPPPGAPGGVGGPADERRKVDRYAWRGISAGGERGAQGYSMNWADLEKQASQFIGSSTGVKLQGSFDYDEVYDPRAYGPAALANLKQDFIGERDKKYRDEFSTSMKDIQSRFKSGELSSKERAMEIANLKKARANWFGNERGKLNDLINAYGKAEDKENFDWGGSEFGDYYTKRTSEAYKTITPELAAKSGRRSLKYRTQGAYASTEDSGGKLAQWNTKNPYAPIESIGEEQKREAREANAPTNRMKSSALKKLRAQCKSMGYKLTKIK